VNKRKMKFIGLSAILIILGCITIYNIKNPVIKGFNGRREINKYNGQKVVSDVFYTDFSETEYLGRSEDKDFKVYAYRNDSNYNLFTLVGSDNTNTYKTEDFVIPTSGDVTKVFIDPSIRASDNKVIKKPTDIEILKKIVSYKNDERTYHIDNIYTEGNEIYFAYDNCPVTVYDNLAGYIAYIDETWISVSLEHYRSWNNSEPLYEAEANLRGSKIIDSELIEWLNKNSTELAPPSYKEQ